MLRTSFLPQTISDVTHVWKSASGGPILTPNASGLTTPALLDISGGAFSSYIMRVPSLNKTFAALVLIFSILVGLIVLMSVPKHSEAWGFWAHREINRYAIQSLPKEMNSFFLEHAETIIQRSVEPDTRRHSDPKEQFYHYIDIDRYGNFPFSELPRDYESAVKKFGKERVDSNGAVPWRIADFVEKLTHAMRRKNKEDIIYYASYIGHYVADAHVPLHTTDNYDGQLTNQKGIHSRWESRLPEMFGAQYDLKAQPVEFIADPLNHIFDLVLESYKKVDSVLSYDLKAIDRIAEADRYKKVERRGKTEKQLSDAYYHEYHKLLDGMVERRINESIKGVASYWYTAWVNAGRPILLDKSKPSIKNGNR